MEIDGIINEFRMDRFNKTGEVGETNDTGRTKGNGM